MKEQKNANKILYIIIAIIIVAGAIVYGMKKLNMELLYSNRQEIIVSNATELNENKIQEIANTVFENKKVKVQKVERFGNAVSIVCREISEEEKTNMINKINDEYNSNISNENIHIIDIPGTRVKDIIKPYILPGILTFSIVLIYFAIMYHKLNITKVLLKSISVPVISITTYYAIISITRIPFGRIVNSIAIAIYIITVGLLTIHFQKEQKKLSEEDKKEND